MKDGVAVPSRGGIDIRNRHWWLGCCRQVHGSAGERWAEYHRTQHRLPGTGPVPRAGGTLAEVVWINPPQPDNGSNAARLVEGRLSGGMGAIFPESHRCCSITHQKRRREGRAGAATYRNNAQPYGFGTIGTFLNATTTSLKSKSPPPHRSSKPTTPLSRDTM